MKYNCSQLLEMAKQADLEDRPTEAVELFKAAFKVNPSMPAYARFRLADNLRLIGKFNEADEVFSKIELVEVPADKRWLLYLHKGQLCVERMDMEMAISCFEKAMELNPKATSPHVFLASVYARIQEPVKAQEILLRGLETVGDRDEVYLNLGCNYRTLGKYVLAISAFEKALEITPDYPEAQEELRDVTAALKFLETK